MRSQCATALSPVARCRHCRAASSAMRAQHESDSNQVRQPQTRSHHPAALSAAAQCCGRRAKCDDSHQVPASHKRPAPSCPQHCSPVLPSPRRVPC
eukprot:5246069-Prymnesium_polylepis.1